MITTTIYLYPIHYLNCESWGYNIYIQFLVIRHRILYVIHYGIYILFQGSPDITDNHRLYAPLIPVAAVHQHMVRRVRNGPGTLYHRFAPEGEYGTDDLQERQNICKRSRSIRHLWENYHGRQLSGKRTAENAQRYLSEIFLPG